MLCSFLILPIEALIQNSWGQDLEDLSSAQQMLGWSCLVLTLVLFLIGLMLSHRARNSVPRLRDYVDRPIDELPPPPETLSERAGRHWWSPLSWFIAAIELTPIGYRGQPGQNPYLGMRNDWIHDRGDGSWDQVFDLQRWLDVVETALESRRKPPKDLDLFAAGHRLGGWVPRKWLMNDGSPASPVWDPERRSWCERRATPQKDGYRPPVADQSTGDGSGA